MGAGLPPGALNATERAAESLGLSVEVIWYDFGAFVADIGNREPVFPVFFQLLLWNESILAWEPTAVGASDLLLEDGNVIGWFLTLFDSGTSPIATPVHPFPTVAFRNHLANTGATGSGVPKSLGLQWRFDTGGAEIGASPVGAGGTLYQVTLFNGTYALDLQTGAQRWRAEGVTGLSTPALYREAGQIVVPLLGARPLPADLIAGSRDGAIYRLRGATGEIVGGRGFEEKAQHGVVRGSRRVRGVPAGRLDAQGRRDKSWRDGRRRDSAQRGPEAGDREDDGEGEQESWLRKGETSERRSVGSPIPISQDRRLVDPSRHERRGKKAMASTTCEKTPGWVGGDITALKEQLEEVETELGEIGETIQKALDRDFQEEYEVGDVRITKADRISILIKLVPDED